MTALRTISHMLARPTAGRSVQQHGKEVLFLRTKLLAPLQTSSTSIYRRLWALAAAPMLHRRNRRSHPHRQQMACLEGLQGTPRLPSRRRPRPRPWRPLPTLAAACSDHATTTEIILLTREQPQWSRLSWQMLTMAMPRTRLGWSRNTNSVHADNYVHGVYESVSGRSRQ